MTTKLVALVLLCLVSGTAMAQEPKVTSLMSKDLTANPGREVLMITAEHAPGGSSAIHRHNAHALTLYRVQMPQRQRCSARPPTVRSRCGIKRYLSARAIQEVCSSSTSPKLAW